MKKEKPDEFLKMRKEMLGFIETNRNTNMSTMDIVDCIIVNWFRLENQRKEVIEELCKPTRLEVVECGVKRHFVNMNLKIEDFSLQDKGRTLKIFIKQMEGKENEM